MADGIFLDNVMEGAALDPERERVRELRLSGLGYEAIAEKMGLSIFAVLDYCVELGIPGEGEIYLSVPGLTERGTAFHKMSSSCGRVCQQCGAQILQGTMGRPRRFCSNECKNTYWNSLRVKRKRSGRLAICKNCGAPFRAVNESKAPRLFCCRKCYFDYRYRRDENAE